MPDPAAARAVSEPLCRSCQCSRFPERCTSDITQEDLRCDACRTGSCCVRFRGVRHVGWQYVTHVSRTWDENGYPLPDQWPDEGSWIIGEPGIDWRPLHQVGPDGVPFHDPSV